MTTNGSGRVDIETAAKLSGASVSTIRRLIRSGRLSTEKQRRSGRERLTVDRRELLALLGRDELEGGPGSVVKHRGHDQGAARGHDSVTADQGELVRLLQGELAKREHENEGLRQQLAALSARLEEERAEVRRLNAELLGLLKQERSGASEPRGLMRRILGL
jgi:hypothetical protein